jgi:hypothetical protein
MWDVSVEVCGVSQAGIGNRGGTTMKTFTMHTPWGQADHCENLGRGVMSVSTPSHGGLFVPGSMVGNVSVAGRADAKRWSGSEQWYEEDCCWAHVAVAFPDLFTADQVASAASMLKSRGFVTGGAV